MPTWPFWVLFLTIGAVAMLVAKKLDDLERRRWSQDELGSVERQSKLDRATRPVR